MTQPPNQTSEGQSQPPNQRLVFELESFEHLFDRVIQVNDWIQTWASQHGKDSFPDGLPEEFLYMLVALDEAIGPPEPGDSDA